MKNLGLPFRIQKTVPKAATIESYLRASPITDDQRKRLGFVYSFTSKANQKTDRRRRLRPIGLLRLKVALVLGGDYLISDGYNELVSLTEDLPIERIERALSSDKELHAFAMEIVLMKEA